MKSKLGILSALILGLAITGATFAQTTKTPPQTDMKTTDSAMSGKMMSKKTKKHKKHSKRKHHHHHHHAAKTTK